MFKLFDDKIEAFNRFLYIGQQFFLCPNNLSQRKELHKKEDSLKALSLAIIQGRTDEDRFNADSQFTKLLVRALKIKNSFYYPFDSLVTISKLVPADSTFKIFTWQMVVNDNVTRQHGAIQMKTADGSLKLFPLIDKSGVTRDAVDTIGNNFGWIGAVYYKLVEKQAFGKNITPYLVMTKITLAAIKRSLKYLLSITASPYLEDPTLVLRITAL